jgi:hypothetical protein
MSWNQSNYLPLMTTRDMLIVLEILQFGIKYPHQLIYKTNHRAIRAKEFRIFILKDWNKLLFQDIMDIVKPTSLLLEKITDKMTEKNAQEHTFVDWLEASIMVYCSINHPDLFQIDYKIEWTKQEWMHWRLFFARLLIQDSE